MRPTRTLRTAVRLLGLTLLTTALLAGPAGATTTTSAAGSLRITDLGTPGGNQGSFAYAINNRGQVVGSSAETMEMPSHALLWRNGHMRDLGTFGGTTSVAKAINDRGEVVGDSAGAEWSIHAVLWRRGEIVGGSGTTQEMVSDAFLWRNGRMRDLGTPSGTFGSTALAINNRGDIVGYTVTPRSDRALLWRNGRMRDLGTLGGEFSWATGINKQGLIVGHSETATGQWRGFVLRHGAMTALPTLASSCDVWGVNDRGQVIGDSWAPLETQSGYHAVLWS